MLAGLLKEVKAEFFAASSRPAAVYRGNPFQIEVGIAYGGDLPGDELGRVIRFANRVPLLYQQSACCSFKAVVEAGWRNYGLQQARGSLPSGPVVVMIHMASTWVPFTSESKEAIADYDEIRKEMRLALQECGRKLGTYLRRRQKMRRESERRNVFARYIGEISMACERITGSDAGEIRDALESIAERKTAEADQQLDDEGRVVDDGGRLAADDSVIILEPAGASGGDDEAAGGGDSLFADLAPPKKSRGKIVKKNTRKTTKKKRPGTTSTRRRKSDG
jgi:DNA topoisomerase-6 subunit B